MQCDLSWLDGSGRSRSRRAQVLQRPGRARPPTRGLDAFAGTELEFIVFDDTYEQAWDRRYRGLTPANRYNVDYSILGGTRVEPLLREIRNGMYATPGMHRRVGQGRVQPRPARDRLQVRPRSLRTCDNHVVYKNGAKEIAAQHGKSLTFMAKYDEREGNSCHIHLSLRGEDGAMVFADDATGRRSRALFEHFIAGMLATMRELTLLYAPNVNSYKRFSRGLVRPDRRGVGARQPHLRPAGRRPRRRAAGREPPPRRRRQPLPRGGGDARRRAARHRERAARSSRAFDGNAYAADKPHVPTHPARGARPARRVSALARAAFGDDVVDHYVNAADVELAAFDAAVTDWERVRGFERL